MINSLRPRLNRNFADDIFKHIFLNENILTSIKISLKLVSKGPINAFPVLVQIMAWRQPGEKQMSEQLSEPGWCQAIIWTNGDYSSDACMRHSPSKNYRKI